MTLRNPIAEALHLLRRVEYCLHHGWVDAARDSLGRAIEILQRLPP